MILLHSHFVFNTQPGNSMDKLNWNRAFALEQAADDAELLQELIDIFKDSCVGDFAAIKNGLDAQDSEMICAAAHSIKGAAASLGIEAIREVAFEMENDSRNGSLTVAKSRVNELDNLLKLLQEL